MGFTKNNIDGTIIHTDGVVSFPEKISVGTTTISGDETVHIDGYLFIDAVGGTDAFLAMGDGSLADVSNPDEGRIRYNTGAQQWEVSADGGAYVSIATGSSAGPWTETATIVYPDNAAWDVVVGGSSMFGGERFRVIGDSAFGGSLTIEPTVSGPNILHYESTGGTTHLTIRAQNTTDDTETAGNLYLYAGDAATLGSSIGGDVVIAAGLGDTQGSILIQTALAATMAEFDSESNLFDLGPGTDSVTATGNPTWHFGTGTATFLGNLYLGAAPADFGRIRLSNNDEINWQRNAGGDGIPGIKVDNSDNMIIGGNDGDLNEIIMGVNGSNIIRFQGGGADRLTVDAATGIVSVAIDLEIGSNPAQLGQLRMSNSDAMVFRNGTDDGEIQALYVDGYDQLVVGRTDAGWAPWPNEITLGSENRINFNVDLDDKLIITDSNIDFTTTDTVTATGDPTFNFGSSLSTFEGDVQIDGKLTVDGYLDPVAVIIESAGDDAFLEMGPGQSAGRSLAGEGRIRYNNVSTQWELSANGDPYVAISTGGSTSPWTEAAGLVYTNNTSWDVLIGTTTQDSAEKLRVVGESLFESSSPESIPVLIRSFAGQSDPLFEIMTEFDDTLFEVDGYGDVVFGENVPAPTIRQENNSGPGDATNLTIQAQSMAFGGGGDGGRLILRGGMGDGYGGGSEGVGAYGGGPDAVPFTIYGAAGQNRPYFEVVDGYTDQSVFDITDQSVFDIDENGTVTCHDILPMVTGGSDLGSTVGDEWGSIYMADGQEMYFGPAGFRIYHDSIDNTLEFNAIQPVSSNDAVQFFVTVGDGSNISAVSTTVSRNEALTGTNFFTVWGGAVDGYAGDSATAGIAVYGALPLQTDSDALRIGFLCVPGPFNYDIGLQLPDNVPIHLGSNMAGGASFEYDGSDVVTDSATWSFGGDVEVAGKLTVDGYIDPIAIIIEDKLSGDGAFFEMRDGSAAGRSSVDEGRIRYNQTEQRWEMSANNNAYEEIAAGASLWTDGGSVLTPTDDEQVECTGGLKVSAGQVFDFDGTNIDLDPTGTFHLSMDNEQTVTIVASDGSSGAFHINDGSNVLIDIDTDTETFIFGNSTDNPAYNFAGSGEVGVAGTMDVTGNVDMHAGLDVDGGNITFTGADIDLDPTGDYTLDMDPGKSGTILVSDNHSNAYRIMVGSVPFIHINTNLTNPRIGILDTAASGDIWIGTTGSTSVVHIPGRVDLPQGADFQIAGQSMPAALTAAKLGACVDSGNADGSHNHTQYAGATYWTKVTTTFSPTDDTVNLIAFSATASNPTIGVDDVSGAAPDGLFIQAPDSTDDAGAPLYLKAGSAAGSNKAAGRVCIDGGTPTDAGAEGYVLLRTDNGSTNLLTVHPNYIQPWVSNMTWADTVSTPSINQAQHGSAAGEIFTIVAQQGFTNQNGGDLILIGGADGGSATGGDAILRAGDGNTEGVAALQDASSNSMLTVGSGGLDFAMAGTATITANGNPTWNFGTNTATFGGDVLLSDASYLRIGATDPSTEGDLRVRSGFTMFGRTDNADNAQILQWNGNSLEIGEDQDDLDAMTFDVGAGGSGYYTFSRGGSNVLLMNKDGNVIQPYVTQILFDESMGNVALGHVTDGSGAGANLTVYAQGGFTDSAGGDLYLQGGAGNGAGADGDVYIRNGTTDNITVTPTLVTIDNDLTVTGKLTVDGYIDPIGITIDDPSGQGAYVELTAGQNAVASSSNQGRIVYNSSTNHFEISENGGSYAQIATGSGTAEWTRSSDVLTPVTNTVDRLEFSDSATDDPVITQADRTGSAGDHLYVLAQTTDTGNGGNVVLGGGVGDAGSTAGTVYFRGGATDIAYMRHDGNYSYLWFLDDAFIRNDSGSITLDVTNSPSTADISLLANDYISFKTDGIVQLDCGTGDSIRFYEKNVEVLNLTPDVDGATSLTFVDGPTSLAISQTSAASTGGVDFTISAQSSTTGGNGGTLNLNGGNAGTGGAHGGGDVHLKGGTPQGGIAGQVYLDGSYIQIRQQDGDKCLDINTATGDMLMNANMTSPELRQYSQTSGAASVNFTIAAQGNDQNDGGALVLKGGTSTNTNGSGGNINFEPGLKDGNGTSGTCFFEAQEAAQTPITIMAAGSQTANLFEIQDDAASALLSVNSDGSDLTFGADVAIPLITQADASGNCDNFYLRAQTSTDANAGTLILQGGNSGGGSGDVAGGVQISSGTWGSGTRNYITMTTGSTTVLRVINDGTDNKIAFNGDDTALITMEDDSDVAGRNITLQAQTTTDSGSDGGNVILDAGGGAGAGDDGFVECQSDGVRSLPLRSRTVYTFPLFAIITDISGAASEEGGYVYLPSDDWPAGRLQCLLHIVGRITTSGTLSVKIKEVGGSAIAGSATTTSSTSWEHRTSSHFVPDPGIYVIEVTYTGSYTGELAGAYIEVLYV